TTPPDVVDSTSAVSRLPFSQESPAIPKKKPPSQRPERTMDATARAIANAREQGDADKSLLPKRMPEAGSLPPANRARVGGGRRPSAGPAPSASTKRPKQ